MSRKYLAVLASFLLVAPLAAFGQASDTMPARADAASASNPAPHLKSPVTAALYSVIFTGAGQMYAGKVGKGWVLLGLLAVETTVGAIEAGNQVFCGPKTTDFSLANGHSCDNTGIILAGAAMLGTWGYSIFSAPGDAREYNENHRKHVAQIQPIIQLGRTDKFGHSPKMFGLRVELPTGKL